MKQQQPQTPQTPQQTCFRIRPGFDMFDELAAQIRERRERDAENNLAGACITRPLRRLAEELHAARMLRWRLRLPLTLHEAEAIKPWTELATLARKFRF